MSSPDTRGSLRPGHLWRPRSRSTGRSQPSGAPIAEASIARDLEAESGNDEDEEEDNNSIDESDSDSESAVSTLRPDNAHSSSLHYSMVGSYRRPSFTTAGPRATVVFGQGADRIPTKQERREARREERSLLRDNNVIPPKHPQRGEGSESVTRRLNIHIPVVGVPGGDRKVIRPGEAPPDGATTGDPLEASETTALLGDPNLPYGGQDTHENINRQWEEAVAAGKIQTTWQREAKVLSRYSAPLIMTFLLQYSLTVASIFTVGHLGKVELGAVSLASMTANITGYAIYQGLATSLDTLCAQAYGSGKKKLVGLQMQRMVYFLCTITIPIGIIW